MLQTEQTSDVFNIKACHQGFQIDTPRLPMGKLGITAKPKYYDGILLGASSKTDELFVATLIDDVHQC